MISPLKGPASSRRTLRRSWRSLVVGRDLLYFVLSPGKVGWWTTKWGEVGFLGGPWGEIVTLQRPHQVLQSPGGGWLGLHCPLEEPPWGHQHLELPMPGTSTSGATGCGPLDSGGNIQGANIWMYQPLDTPEGTGSWRYLFLEVPTPGGTNLWRYRSLEVPISGGTDPWRYRPLEVPVSGGTSPWIYQPLEVPVPGGTSLWR